MTRQIFRAGVLGLFASAFLLNSASAAVLFEDNFSGDLSKWNMDTLPATINPAQGYPAPSVQTDWEHSLYSKATFSYAGRDLEISADLMTPNNGPGQSYTTLALMNFNNPSLATVEMRIATLDNGQYSNSAFVTVTDNTNGHQWTQLCPLANYGLIISSNSWHRAKIRIKSTGIVEFLLDDRYIVNENNGMSVANFGPGHVWIGGQTNYYDNVLVTPEPATLLLFAGMGLLVRRRRSGR